jgi:transposase
MININSEIGISLLNNVINNNNLTDDEIKKELSKINLNWDDLRNKINDKLYGDLSKQKTIEAVEKTCKKENLNNSRKIDYRKRKNLIENLDTDEIKEILSKEKVINIVLDNYRVHHAKIVEKACEILNIRLIFLPPYSPFLNPIEDVWRKIKREIYKSFLKTLDFLKNLFEEIFYEIIDNKTFYEEWVKTYT